MSDQTKTTREKSWWKSVKAMFRRIIWPTKEDTARQTAVVLVISIILALLIAVFDNVLLQIVDFIIAF